VSDKLAAKAAYILFRIATAHPFIDGNKRTAFGTADIFLRLNGHFLKVDAREGQSFVVRIATGKVVEGSVRKWTRQRLKKL
jgi:death-on-curing protein